MSFQLPDRDQNKALPDAAEMKRREIASWLVSLAEEEFIQVVGAKGEKIAALKNSHPQVANKAKTMGQMLGLLPTDYRALFFRNDTKGSVNPPNARPERAYVIDEKGSISCQAPGLTVPPGTCIAFLKKES